MKDNKYPRPYNQLNQIQEKQKSNLHIYSNKALCKSIKKIDNLDYRNKIQDKIANVFSLAMQPCAAVFIKDNTLCLFANYAKLGGKKK